MSKTQHLQQITQLRLQADRANLAVVLSKENDLRQTLQDLAHQRKQRLDTPQDGGDAASVAIADLNWQLWIDQRRTIINAELARVLAEKEELTAKLRRSFGKDQAAQRLYQTSQATARIAVARKALYES
ncbi:hypothetical protein [Roseobacter sp. CCS2]|uniref:hypothetical protein n=1 Tax=Roseobacter sp. CCS2 TaxID=391593 RepID=UPI0000F4008D|nr:hypothetical protein [Roseobacter sp. CCS2]EBA13841.1 hypothetical protein RCCS2_08129 [Roseobacter sp. CCS2]